MTTQEFRPDSDPTDRPEHSEHTEHSEYPDDPTAREPIDGQPVLLPADDPDEGSRQHVAGGSHLADESSDPVADDESPDRADRTDAGLGYQERPAGAELAGGELTDVDARDSEVRDADARDTDTTVAERDTAADRSAPVFGSGFDTPGDRDADRVDADGSARAGDAPATEGVVAADETSVTGATDGTDASAGSDATEASTAIDTPAATGASDGAGDSDADWHELQGRFVDDPATAVKEAGDLLERAVKDLRGRLESGSTEDLRTAFRRYRDLHQTLS